MNRSSAKRCWLGAARVRVVGNWAGDARWSADAICMSECARVNPAAAPGDMHGKDRHTLAPRVCRSCGVLIIFEAQARVVLPRRLRDRLLAAHPGATDGGLSARLAEYGCPLLILNCGAFLIRNPSLK